jgi:hypothetical protein
MQFHLSGGRSPLYAQAPGDTLLQDLQHGGGRAALWLADQQMNVFGHDNVADQSETIAVAYLIENLDKNVSRAN